MKADVLAQRLAVCSWSLQPASPADLIAKLRDAGLGRVQLALDPLREIPAVWGGAAARLRGAGITIVSGMFGCRGEDYSTLETIRASGGLVPDATWEQNLANIAATAALARELGLRFVTFHAGFLPHAESDPSRAKMLTRLAKVADGFAAAGGLAVGLETGQETAAALRQVLEQLDRPNVGVNFDPANMILYGSGDPVEGLRLVGPWVRQVHIKDARRTRVPGTWGEEVVVGDGEVDWRAFFATLEELGFQGDFVIEREAGDRRVADVRTAREVVARQACEAGVGQSRGK